jgi:hypothetical protein
MAARDLGHLRPVRRTTGHRVDHLRSFAEILRSPVVSPRNGDRSPYSLVSAIGPWDSSGLWLPEGTPPRRTRSPEPTPSCRFPGTFCRWAPADVWGSPSKVSPGLAAARNLLPFNRTPNMSLRPDRCVFMASFCFEPPALPQPARATQSDCIASWRQVACSKGAVVQTTDIE